jgi:hypothetical protein
MVRALVSKSGVDISTYLCNPEAQFANRLDAALTVDKGFHFRGVLFISPGEDLAETLV